MPNASTLTMFAGTQKTQHYGMESVRIFMNIRQSARSLLCLSFVLLAAGAVITDPAAGFVIITVAGLGTLGYGYLGDRRLNRMVSGKLWAIVGTSANKR